MGPWAHHSSPYLVISISALPAIPPSSQNLTLPPVQETGVRLQAAEPAPSPRTKWVLALLVPAS
jgi:hypothetical protein